MPETILPSVKLVLKTVSQSGEQVAISASVSVTLKPTYTVTIDNQNITSDETVVFSIITEHIPNGTELFWDIVFSDILPSKFSDTSTDGVVVITDGIATVEKTLLTITPDLPVGAYIYINVFSDSGKQSIVTRSTKVTIYCLSNET